MDRRKATTAAWNLAKTARLTNQAATRIPERVASATAAAIKQSGLSRKSLRSDTRQLHEFLFSRRVVKAACGVSAQEVTEEVKYRPTLHYGKREAITYLAGRQPVCYAATRRILDELKLRRPHFTPGCVLDFGSGVGTTIWATQNVWGDRPVRYTCVDSSEDMIELSTAVQAHSNAALDPPDVAYRQLLPVPKDDPEYDLVVSSFSLCEISEKRLRRKVILNLWAHTSDHLVIVESGSPQGFELVHEARDYLLDAGANIVSPCPHQLSCPRHGTVRPCHFPLRVELPPAHRFSGLESSTGVRAEKISYLVVSKAASGLVQRPRIISPPMQRPGHCVFELCTSKQTGSAADVADSGQITRLTIPKSVGKEAWVDCKSRSWGDVFPQYSKSYPAAMPEDEDDGQTSGQNDRQENDTVLKE